MDNTEKIRVLVVEDNRIAQKVARIILQSLDCEIDIIDNGCDALRFFGENCYDLIFMDLGLPGQDGYGVATDIREMEKRNSLLPVPIIGLSVHTGETFRKRALNAGMNDYELKPLTIENCRLVLKRFLPSKFLLEKSTYS